VNLRDYLGVARKRWRLVAGAIVAAAILAGLVTVQTPPQYATSITFFVTTPNSGVTDAYQGGLFSQQRVKSYASLLTSDRLAAVVAKEAQTGLTAREVRTRIAAKAVQETVLLEAVVTDGRKARSLRIAQELAKRFKELVEMLETPPDKQVSSVKVEVVAGPELNEEPVAPRPVRNVSLALLLGLVVGLGAAVLREVLDTTVKSSESLQELASAPVLANVPFDPAAKDRPLLTGAGRRSARAEALRQLRTNLEFVDVDHPVQVLVVTSAIPGEGKSSTACNLAILFAETGKRVLLIDADLRRPCVANYLGIEGAAGLTTVLVGQAKIDDVLQRWGSDLWVLPSGVQPPNPSELLGSRHMAELIGGFRKDYDMIVIDCPPLLPVTDGAVVAARADGALLIARSRKTTSSQVTAAAKSLSTVDARLLGCVFNMVPAGGSDTYYTYYGHGNHPSGRRHGRQDAAGSRGSAFNDPLSHEDPRPVDTEERTKAPVVKAKAPVVKATAPVIKAKAPVIKATAPVISAR
jgi:capsular exopolysaccharide synthesis family protein